MGFSETFLDERVKDSELMIAGYNLFRRDRPGRGGGGVVVYVSDDIPVVERPDLESSDLEAIWLEVKQFGCKPILVCHMYRPPDATNVWLEALDSVLEKVQVSNMELIMMGDFNVDLLKESPLKDNFLAITESFQLAQLIEDPTRTATRKDKITGIETNSTTLIDHVYTSCPSRIPMSKVLHVSLSDHFGILTVYTNKNARPRGQGHKFIHYRDTKKLNVEAFLNDLAQVSWYSLDMIPDPNDALAMWYHMFEQVLNVHTPTRKKRVKHWHQPEWLNQDILTAIHYRNHLFKQQRFNEYKKQRNLVKREIRRARRDFYHTMVTNQRNSKKTWQCIRKLDGSKTPHFPSVVHDEHGAPVHDDSGIASTFNNHFAKICTKSELPESSDSKEFSEKLEEHVKSKKQEHVLFSIPPMTEDFVYKQLQNLDASKATGLDNLSPFILKQSAPVITPVLTKIFNQSLQMGIFPDVWKIAKVTPLHKKGPREDVNNYRPISVLCCISKIIEKHVHDWFYSFLNEHKLLHEGQSGFRCKHSCATALTRMTDTWLSALDDGQMVGSAFIDLRKAFDSVNHALLIQKLIVYGCSPGTIAWFSSYLDDRSQIVNFKGSFSESQAIGRGVPQGSILGPLLFIVFVNDIPLHLTECETDLYADDTTVYTIGSTVEEIQNKLQENVSILCKWCKCNDLIINAEKTNSMLITVRQKRCHLEDAILSIKVDENVIPMCSNQKVLGVNLDQNFNWEKQISSTCQSINYRLYILRRISPYLTTNARIAFCTGYIMPSMDYCSTIWGGTSNTNIAKVERLQKRAARLIFDDYVSPSRQLFVKLKWLPVANRIEHNKAVLVYKCLNDMMPEYMNNMFTAQTSSVYSLRSEARGDLYVPKPRIELFKQSLLYSGPKIWNSLPVTVRQTDSLPSFKKRSHSFQLNQAESRS